METISISSLKAHLSAKIKEVQNGSRITVLDHRRPVAVLTPLEEEPLFVREASSTYSFKQLKPLTDIDPLEKLQAEREER
jgi:prevent-host-death family protein